MLELSVELALEAARLSALMSEMTAVCTLQDVGFHHRDVGAIF
jgi:hypothetical protein